MSGFNAAWWIAIGIGILLLVADFLLPENKWKKRAGLLLLPLGLVCIAIGVVGMARQWYVRRPSSQTASKNEPSPVAPPNQQLAIPPGTQIAVGEKHRQQQQTVKGRHNQQQQQGNSGGTNTQQQSSGQDSPNLNCPGGICAGHDISGSPSVINKYEDEPITRSIPKPPGDEWNKLSSTLREHPAPFWMMTASDIHGKDGKIRETDDEQGAFEVQLENLLANSGWEDFMITKCKDSNGLLEFKHNAGVVDSGDAALARGFTFGGSIDATLFSVPGCAYPAYEGVFHGILIESPLEFMPEANMLSQILTNLRIRNSVRQADIIPNNKTRLQMIVIHVGTT